MDVFETIKIVPEYHSNDQLARRIRDELSGLVERRYDGRRPPTFIIFRPTGRPRDEFENVEHLIESSSQVYLIVAFSGQPKNITDLVPYRLQDRIRSTHVIFIKNGQLVSETSQNFASNQQAFRNIATQISQDYRLQKRQEPPKPDDVKPATPDKKKPSSSSFKSSIKGFFKNEESQATKKEEKDGEQSLEFVVTDEEIRILVPAVLIMNDFPRGLGQKDLFRIMELNDKEKTKLKDMFGNSRTIFTSNTMSGDKNMKFQKDFFQKVKNMKSGPEYQRCKEAITKRDEMMDNDVYPFLFDVCEFGDRNQETLDRIDKDFKLNGQLRDILLTVRNQCELCTETLKGNTLNPSQPSLNTVNTDQSEESEGTPVDRMDIGLHEVQGNTSGTVPLPKEQGTLSGATLSSEKTDKKDTDSDDPKEDFMDADPTETLVPLPNEQGTLSGATLSSEKTDKQDNAIDDPKEDVMDADDPTETLDKQLIASLKDVWMLIGQLQSNPGLLDPKLVELVKAEFNIPGKLEEHLSNIAKRYKQETGDRTETVPPPAAEKTELVVSCETFMKIMDKLQFDEELKKSLENEFHISANKILEGLQNVYKKLTEMQNMR